MKSLRALKKRIKSIKNTAKITNALEKVSISKMKKFQNLARESIEYADEIASLATLIAGLVDGKSSEIDPELLAKYFTANTDNTKPIAIITLAPTRGFCGSLISDMINYLAKNLIPEQKYAGIGLQRKSWYIMSKFPSITIETLFENPIETPNFELIKGPFDYIMENYLQKKYAKVFIFYVEYNGSFNYKPVMRQLLPLSFSELLTYINTDDEKQMLKQEYILEPNKNQLFAEIVERYLRTMFLFTLITTKASEHNARMIAMKNATDNAKQLNEVLNLQYNKSRQETITTELLDIIGGNIN